jgi:ketosteroid isomerase-like protein
VTDSANLDLVRSIYADWKRGDFSRIDFADPGIEIVNADGLERGSWTGVSAWMERRDDLLSAWEEFTVKADEYRELDDERVLVLGHYSGRGTASGLDLAEMGPKPAALFHVRHGKVTRLVVYFDRGRALADLGLAPEGDPS